VIESPRGDISDVGSEGMGESFGEWLRATRKHVGLSQRQLGDRLDVTALTVSRWEQGHQQPSAARRKSIERLLLIPSAVAVMDKGLPYGAVRTSIPLYLLGHIAGTTDGEGERIEDLEVPPRLGRLADSAFVLHGSSMEPYFLEGDIVGIRATPVASEGQFVVAQADGELTFKRFDGVADDRSILSALNPSHRPILPTEIKIVGVYRWSIRERKDGRI